MNYGVYSEFRKRNYFLINPKFKIPKLLQTKNSNPEINPKWSFEIP